MYQPHFYLSPARLARARCFASCGHRCRASGCIRTMCRPAILRLDQTLCGHSATSSGSEKGEGDGGDEQRQEAKMLVTFRVKDIETRLHSKPAQIRPPELAALMRRLHRQQYNRCRSRRIPGRAPELRDQCQRACHRRVRIMLRPSSGDDRDRRGSAVSWTNAADRAPAMRCADHDAGERTHRSGR